MYGALDYNFDKYVSIIIDNMWFYDVGDDNWNDKEDRFIVFG